MAIRFSGSTEIRPRGEAVKMPAETIRDLADQVQAKEKNRNPDGPSKPISLRVRPKVLLYFKATGRDWQTRMNDVLEDWVDRQIKG